MNNEKMVKIELGCGKTKNPGFIGVDRFNLPGVDIVADLNKSLPFDDSSVDVVFACHSLEHMDDIQHTMKEIYRICKHKAFVLVLAPYYNTYTNIANPYHLSNYNEDTFRFFTTEKESLVDINEYYNAHSYIWGLSDSDNSETPINLMTLDMEFFYFTWYKDLNEDARRNARRALNNVCDQIYYVMVVNKENEKFEKFEIDYLKEKAKTLEPPIVDAVRNRIDEFGVENNFYKDIIDKIATEKQLLSESLNQKISDAIQNSKEEFLKIDKDIHQTSEKNEILISNAVTHAKSELVDIIESNKQNINDRVQKIYDHIDDNNEALYANTGKLKIELQSMLESTSSIQDGKISSISEAILELERYNKNSEKINSRKQSVLKKQMFEKIGMLESSLHRYTEDEIQVVDKKIEGVSLNFNEYIESLNKSLDETKLSISQLRDQINAMDHKINQIELNMDSKLNVIDNLNRENQMVVAEAMAIADYSNNNTDLFGKVKRMAPNFVDGVVLQSKVFKKNSILSYSNLIPVEGYLEYSITGKGSYLHFYGMMKHGEQYLLEIVSEGSIIFNHIYNEFVYGYNKILIPSVDGTIYIRFRSVGDFNVGRILEIHNKKLLHRWSKDFAAFLTEA